MATLNPLVRLDKMHATSDGPLESVKHVADMANGSVINLGGLAAGEREVKVVVVPATATLASAEVLLVASPELTYMPAQNMRDFTNVANKAARAYHLLAGDVFTITDDGITGATAVGQFVVAQNGSLQLAAAATDPGNTRFVGVVLEKTTLGFEASPATVIEVQKA